MKIKPQRLNIIDLKTDLRRDKNETASVTAVPHIPIPISHFCGHSSRLPIPASSSGFRSSSICLVTHIRYVFQSKRASRTMPCMKVKNQSALVCFLSVVFIDNVLSAGTTYGSFCGTQRVNSTDDCSTGAISLIGTPLFPNGKSLLTLLLRKPSRGWS